MVQWYLLSGRYHRERTAVGCPFSMVSTLVDRFNGFYRFYRFKGVLILCEQRVFLKLKILRRFPIFMRRTTPVEPIEPSEPAEPLVESAQIANNQ